MAFRDRRQAWLPEGHPFSVSSPEQCFLTAIDVARRQQAKSLELRAATSLARLWQQQNKENEAREILQEIYGWFTEGFDTRDLREAEALLVTLGGTAKSPESQAQRLASKHVQSPKSEVQSHENQTLDPRRRTLDTESLSSYYQSLTPNVFRAEGEYWTVSFTGTSRRLKDARGLHYIAYLLQHPYQEIHVIDLIAVGEKIDEELPALCFLRDPDLPRNYSGGLGDAGAILDPQARAAYKQRLAELREELAEAQRFNDLGRSEQLATEIDFLTHELASAAGLAGRERRIGSPVERARVNITRAVKIALRKITEHHPALGRHFATTIKTGTYCAYTPDTRLPISWQG